MKMAILPKAIYMFNAIPVKIPMTFITEIKTPTLKFIGKHKRPCIAKVILTNRSNVGGVTTIKFKLYYSVIAIQTVLYWCKTNLKTSGTKQKTQNPRNYTPLIFDKVAKSNFGEKTASSTYFSGKTGYLHAEN
jgi:hypothetical protein